MHHRPRHDRPARRRCLGALGVVLTVVVLAMLGGSVVGSAGWGGSVIRSAGWGGSVIRSAGWGSAETRVPTPPESVGAPAPGHSHIALTGPRGITIVAGLGEVRQRAGQVVEADATRLASSGAGPGAGLSLLAPRPLHLAIRGLLAARAPPVTPA
jgi:hypothetical protein